VRRGTSILLFAIGVVSIVDTKQLLRSGRSEAWSHAWLSCPLRGSRVVLGAAEPVSARPSIGRTVRDCRDTRRLGQLLLLTACFGGNCIAPPVSSVALSGGAGRVPVDWSSPGGSARGRSLSPELLHASALWPADALWGPDVTCPH